MSYNGDLDISSNSIKFSRNNLLEGQPVSIYASVNNKSSKDLLGIARFFVGDTQIGADQQISVVAGQRDDIFINWTPSSIGKQQIAVKIYPWEKAEDNPSNNWIKTEVLVKKDTDRDGISNGDDPDDDNDGVPDSEDHFPLDKDEYLDTDGDTIGNNKDLDDDNDGVPDDFDDLPLDSNESIDTDKDGIGDLQDEDDDNDGIKDAQEEIKGLNPKKSDTDGDGFNDSLDSHPKDRTEWVDTDKDGLGNNQDIDDDNDGILDTTDQNPQNHGPSISATSNFKDKKVFSHQGIKIDASKSQDPDGEIQNYIWKINNETVKEGNILIIPQPSTGQQKIQLTVIDNKGEFRTEEYQVNVLDTKLYLQVTSTIFLIILALIIGLKYTRRVKKNDHTDQGGQRKE